MVKSIPNADPKWLTMDLDVRYVVLILDPDRQTGLRTDPGSVIFAESFSPDPISNKKAFLIRCP